MGQSGIGNTHKERGMEDTYTIVERRADGSFVIKKEVDGLGIVDFHVIPDMYPELWAAVCTQEGLDAEAEAAKYREAVAQ